MRYDKLNDRFSFRYSLQALLLPALVASLLAAAACDLDVPDLNNIPEEDLVERPTAALVRAAATGLIIGNRVRYAENNGYISHLGILGRESYNLTEADTRYVTELLGGPLDPGSPAFGANFWIQPYANIHNASNLLRAVDVIASPELSAADLEAIRGYTKTFQALDYLILINTRDVNGAARVTDETIRELAPLVSKEDIFAHIESLLDEGLAHLQAGGPTFPFGLSSGFEGFDTPATFMLFNRALKARVDVYTGDYAAALDSLQASFLVVDPAAPRLDLGVYHSYSILPGDAQNELITTTIYAHPSLVTDAEPADVRVMNKLRAVDERNLQNLSSDLAFSIYADSSTPVAIIRNEELILLRAEANLMLGNVDAAIADINFVRVHSGGLAPRTDLSAADLGAIEDELLYQRRYGLMFEGHRWIDMRRFGRLDELPLDRPDDVVNAAFPIPTAEIDARQGMDPQ